MVSLYFDPNGEKIFSSSINAYKQQQQKDAENHVHAKAGIAIVNSDIADEDNNVASLKARIEELEGILNKMNHEESEVFGSTMNISIIIVKFKKVIVIDMITVLKYGNLTGKVFFKMSYSFTFVTEKSFVCT